MDEIKRVLFWLPERPHYGLDVLYDGLCDLLGDENVREVPAKPTLHGEDGDERFPNYPCRFNRRRGDLAEADALLFGDPSGHMGPLPMNPFCAYVDQEDEWSVACVPWMRAEDLYFKREYLEDVTYPEGTAPLPFSYPLSLIPETPVPHADRLLPVFWAGAPWFGRVEYLEAIYRAGYGKHLWDSGSYAQVDYRWMLGYAQIGLSLRGAGWDTVRYWEIPAHGAMLFAQRPRIVIPDNFVDGESAVFFDTVGECVEKLDHYLKRPEEVARIAAAGHALLKERHTGKARAAQLIRAITEGAHAVA